jgi:hypothetical protein
VPSSRVSCPVDSIAPSCHRSVTLVAGPWPSSLDEQAPRRSDSRPAALRGCRPAHSRQPGLLLSQSRSISRATSGRLLTTGSA